MELAAPGALEVAAAGGLCAATGFMAWAVRGRSSSVFGPSVWRGRSDRRALALTFDDGPSESTPRILEILERHRVPATFFQIGLNVRRLPAVACAVRDAGHEIGNHSETHPLFCFPQTRIEQELGRAQETIGEHTGTRPRWFRAPYGVRWFGLARAQRRFGLTGVMWTVIGYDWKRPAGAVVEHVTHRAGNGAILCLHDGRELSAGPRAGVTIEAVRDLVPRLLDRGFKFESLEQLICPMN